MRISEWTWGGLLGLRPVDRPQSLDNVAVSLGVRVQQEELRDYDTIVLLQREEDKM